MSKPNEQYLDEMYYNSYAYSNQPTVYDYFQTSSSSSESSESTEDATHSTIRKTTITRAAIDNFSDFFHIWLSVPKIFREIIEYRIINPDITHGQMALDLNISEKHLFACYKKMLIDYPALGDFTKPVHKKRINRVRTSKKNAQ